jgi:hypothetical protein
MPKCYTTARTRGETRWRGRLNTHPAILIVVGRTDEPPVRVSEILLERSLCGYWHKVYRSVMRVSRRIDPRRKARPPDLAHKTSASRRGGGGRRRGSGVAAAGAERGWRRASVRTIVSGDTARSIVRSWKGVHEGSMRGCEQDTREGGQPIAEPASPSLVGEDVARVEGKCLVICPKILGKCRDVT